MKTIENKLSATALALRGGTSMMVMGVAIAMASPGTAMAQDAAKASTSGSTDPTTVATPDDTTTASDVIVTGQREALKTSQENKRSANTVIESITANDIGAFPDKSVAEALQRVPGITVNRFAASDDTSHFSSDPSGVLIRGLSQVRSEYNGRDTFSANSSRGLSWEDIAPELMAGVDVYKNQTADLTEGGIAGLINLRTRLPFDSKGQVFEVTANANYGDIRQKATPEVSALYSNRWDTGIGQIGILADLAFSQVKTESQGVVYGRTAVFQDVYGPGTQYIPSSVAYRDTDYDRTRKGASAALQWTSPSGNLAATAQYNRSEYHETWREHGVISYLTDLYNFPADFVFTNGGANASHIPRPAPGTGAFQFDGDGNFVSGTLVNQQTDFSWWGADDSMNGGAGNIALNDQGQPMLHACYNWGPGTPDPANPGQFTCGPDARGPDLNAVTRYNDTHRMTQDAAFNLKWKASERLEFNFDAQYVNSTVNNYDVEVGQYSFANVALDATDGRPTMTFSTPTNINQSAGGLSNPDNYRYNHAMDHLEDDDGTEWAFRVDGTYKFDGGFLDSLKFGYRYSDRDQTVRYSAYNWGNITNDWNLAANQYQYWNIDNYTPAGSFNGYPQGLIDVRNFGGSFFGSTNQYAFFDMDALEQHRVDELSYSNLGVGQDQWEPICSNGGTAQTGPRTGEIPGTCFRPDEINKISETTHAAYVMLNFGGPDTHIGSIGVSGNIGVRFVETRDQVSGSTVFPLIQGASLPCTRNVAGAGQPTPALPYSLGCYVFGNAGLLADATQPPPAGFTDIPLSGSPDAVAFNNGAGLAGNAAATHQNWLPSFNVKFDLSPHWLMRFAISRGLSRPDIGYLKNYTTLIASLPGDDPSDPRYIKNGSGQVVGVSPSYTGNGYNPYLKPTTATSFDFSIENYFAQVGQFSVGIFAKSFQNYIQYGSHFVTFTNNGVTNSVEVVGPSNGNGGSLWGLEGSYQRFFDFLPGALSGLGIQLNGTYVDDVGITNSGLKDQNGTNGGSEAQAGTGGTTLSVASLEGLSKYSYNIVGMYEKYGLAMRVAYNWRSKFLMTAVDCCTYLPMWQQASGTLDASIRYSITPHMEISVQGSNLLNTQTKLSEQVTGAGDGSVLVPNAWFQNDRRFVVGVRAKF